MDVNVRITVEAGANLLPLVNSVAEMLGANVQRTARTSLALEAVEKVCAAVADAEAPAEVEATPEAEPSKEEKPRRVRPSRAVAKPEPVAEVAEEVTETAPATEEASATRDRTDEEKLEAIKEEVTRLVKKGETEDLRKVLTHFEVRKASELAPEQYDDFMEVVRRRFDGGESLAEIFQSDLA